MAFGHGFEQVHVTLDERGLGHDANRMPTVFENLQNRTGDTKLSLGGLVGIGVGAEHHGRAGVAGSRELAREKLGGFGLVEDTTFEVEPRR